MSQFNSVLIRKLSFPFSPILDPINDSYFKSINVFNANTNLKSEGQFKTVNE